jgi:putative transposase
MPFDPEKRSRHSIRLREYDYSQSGSYFVTVCTQGRECLLGEIVDGEFVQNGAGLIVQEVLERLPARYPRILVDSFVIMPSHVHSIIVMTCTPTVGALLAAPSGGRESSPLGKTGAASGAPTLGDVIRAFKSLSAIRVNRLLERIGQPLWQRNYYEHVIRNERTLNAIREYIARNPSQWQEDPDNPDVTPEPVRSEVFKEEVTRQFRQGDS